MPRCGASAHAAAYSTGYKQCALPTVTLARQHYSLCMWSKGMFGDFKRNDSDLEASRIQQIPTPLQANSGGRFTLCNLACLWLADHTFA